MQLLKNKGTNRNLKLLFYETIPFYRNYSLTFLVGI